METTTPKRFNWCYDKKLLEHKSIEIQLSQWDRVEDWFNFNIKWSRTGDHCGPAIMIEIFGWFFCIQIYDHRHWNYDADRFYFPGEEWEEMVRIEAEIGDRNFCGSGKFTITSNTKL